MTTAVTVGPGNSFNPSAIQVSPGATVTWTFAGGTHNVTFSSIAVASGDMSSGTFLAAMPTTPGTYAYSCTIHSGMNGSVLVQ
jgi:plastocyanin